MNTEFDRRLNEWFDAVEPKQIPSSILPQVFGEVRQTGQLRRPWHQFAASFEAAWTRRSALSPMLVVVILTALLIIAVAAMAVAGGLIQIPRAPTFVDGMIAVQDAFEDSAPNELPNYTIRFIDPDTGEDVFTSPESVRSCAAKFSPDGSQYAFLYEEPDDQNFDLYVAIASATADSQPTLLLPNPLQTFFDPSWAPDGSAFVMTYYTAPGTEEHSYRYLMVVPADGTPARRVTDVETSHSADWSSSGDWIAFVGMGPDHPLYVIRPDGTELRKLRQRVGSVAWSPTTDQLAFMGADGWLHVVKPDGAEVAAIPYSPSPPDESLDDFTPAWSPDGTRIALTYGGLKVIDVSSGAVSTIATSVQVGPVEWSADGQRLVTTDENGNLLELSLNGSAPRLIASHVRVTCMSAGMALSWQKVTN